MSGKKKTGLLVLTVGAALLVFFVFLYPNFKTSYVWFYPYYQEDKKDPYALYFIYDLLRNCSDDFTVLKDSLFFEEGEGSSFVFIGEHINADSVQNERLLDFVEEGHVAFIASERFPVSLIYRMCERKHNNHWVSTDEGGEEHEVLLEDFSDGIFYDSFDDSLVYFELGWDTLLFSHRFLFRGRNKARFVAWKELYEELVCPCLDVCPQEEIALRVLGRIRMENYAYDKDEPLGVNFFYLPFGKGRIYLHTSPLAFTNYGLLEEEGFAYASAVFAHLPKGHIYWDSRPPFVFEPGTGRVRNHPSLSETPLKYVLSQPSLAWAWYLLLASAVLFVVFMGKRRQRVVPVLLRPQNTSMEYVALIGQLTFLKGDHKKLGLEMLRLWVGYVHRHYALSLHGELSSEQASALARRSGASPELIEKIFLLKKNIESSSYFKEPVLISLYKLLEAFYEKDRKPRSQLTNSKPS